MLPRPSIKPPVSQKLPTALQRGAFRSGSNTALPTGNVRLMVRVAAFEMLFKLAEIVARPFVVVLVVVTVNVPLCAPAAMAKVAGTVARDELLDKATTEPPAGAGALRVTVAVLVLPPWTELGFSEIEVGVGEGTTVRVVD